MGSNVYIKRTILEMGNLLEEVWTGKAKFENEDTRYRSLRGRLVALSPIIGPLPDFLESAGNLWILWNLEVKGVLDSFEKRRQFLKERYTAYYENRLDQIEALTFEQEMINRDLSILDVIGEGGFGKVYKSEHIVLNEKRAIKKLSPIFVDEEGEEEALRRFSREAKILERLAHPNIVRFIDAGMAGNHPFIIMEFVDGENLSSLVDSEGPLRYDLAHTIMVQILEAVAAAHQAGIVHRDIKPTNLMWDGSRAVILDYGSGQWLEQRLTTRMTEVAIGTIGYIADELRENPRLLTPSIDCFSLGIVFHFLLTGKLPSTGDPAYYLRMLDFSEDVQSTMLKALAPSDLRYSDGTTMLEAFRGITPEEPGVTEQ